MNPLAGEVREAIDRLTGDIVRRQARDGSWRMCFDNGTVIDAWTIVLLRTLDYPHDALIRQLRDRLLAAQHPEGCWKLYPDEEGSLSATVEAYYALLYSGYSPASDEPLQRARSWIRDRGGLSRATSILTRALLAATGQLRWPASVSSIPIEVMLLSPSFPLSLFDFSGYSRVHLVPMLIMADRRFALKTDRTPDLSELLSPQAIDEDELRHRGWQEMLHEFQSALGKLAGTPRSIREAALKKAEQFLLQRIESDGTLYSYASSTLLMVFALLALGYDRRHPVIVRAVQGLTDMRFDADGVTTIQNSPSDIWDTALLAYGLREAGLPPDHEAVRGAAAYLLAKQHRRPGDWQLRNPRCPPGGWGFSETNTLNPDVDDTTAALRALRAIPGSPEVRDSWNRGLHWVITMQNKDGGWPAFEKNATKEILTWLAIDGAKAAAIDRSDADLTGRTLEFIGACAGLDIGHAFVRRGAEWLVGHQERDGSWYGRWGICYIYGTWAALTGLTAAGLSVGHDAVRRGVRWLLDIRNADGGWGESCRSDRIRRYAPLGASTPSQTAWALDALVAASSQPTPEIDQGVRRLIALLHEPTPMSAYPTGAGLPGHFYVHYHSYRYIWPLVALSHYRNKFAR